MKYVILNKEGIPVLATSCLDEATILVLQDGWKYYGVPSHDNEETYSDLGDELLINSESGMLIAQIEIEVSSHEDSFFEERWIRIDEIKVNGFEIDRLNLTDQLKRDIESNVETMKDKLNEKL